MDTRKIIQALVYLAYKELDHEMDNIKAYKLLWLADRYHVRHAGRLITGDSYYAMPKGPVPSDAKNILEGQKTHAVNDKAYQAEYLLLKGNRYEALRCPDSKVFSISDREALDLAYSIFGAMSADELSVYSHAYPEWKAFEEKLLDADKKNSFPIPIDLFFEDSHVNDYGFFDDNAEALSLARELYHEYARI